MNINLTKLEQTEMDKVNVDLTAAGAAFKEQCNMPVVAEVIGREQPKHLRDWFREGLIAHRLASVSLLRLPYEPKVEWNLYYVTIPYTMLATA